MDNPFVTKGYADKGEYTVYDPFFALWLKQNYPI